jgi:hypothetical protein
MQLKGRCTPWEIPNSTERLIFQALHFQNKGVYNKFPGTAGICQYKQSDRLMERSLNVSY